MQKFNYHSHTYRCKHADLDMEDEEYVLDYIKMGFEKIAFTDHCPEKNKIDKRPRMRMDYEERYGYLDSIKKLKEKYKDKIEIKSGYEVEYLPGEEENLKELKDETDILILGQHFIYDEDNKNLKIFGEHDYFSDKKLLKYAEYLEKAMEYNIPDIIAHPDIYLFNRNEFGKSEAEACNIICQAAEKYNIPLEINLNKIYLRLFYKNDEKLSFDEQIQKLREAYIPYPNKEFWKIASDYNIKVLYGLDAHHRNQIKYWNDLIKLAEYIIGEDIIKKLNFVNEVK